METPDYLAELLAKSDRETLFEHTWQVLSRFADLVHLRRHIPALIASPRLWHQLYWACFLHDFGKAAGGFQRMLATRGKERWPYRHEVGSLAFLGWLFPDPHSDDYRWIVAAIVSHHKDAKIIGEQYQPGGPSVAALAAELSNVPLADLWRWINEYRSRWQHELSLLDCGIEQPDLLPQSQAVALVREQGAAQIEQALRTYRRFTADLATPLRRKHATVTLALRGIIITADHSASAHVGPPPTLPPITSSTILQRLGWQPQQLHDHQRRSAAAVGDVVLMAPTGSGKTEAALFWAFGALARPLPRLFYALPFQASMNAMRERLEFLFSGQVGLQHSRALQALYRTYIENGDDPRFAMQQAKMEKNRTELNYFPVRVFSPYQMLKACYRLRGYEAIMSDFFGAAFILDEIHAYEPKRLGLILALVGHLKQRYGARFFVMSATFPDLIRTALCQALGDYTEITASVALFQEFRRHRLRLLSGDLQEPQHTAMIVADAQRGQSVLVCCNTVARAQEAWRYIHTALGDQATVVLLHSRLNGRDRLKREAMVRRACGLGSNERRPIVLVATQVIEVSLNIDLDTIYTDLAPLEALIQRFGRVNRERRRDNEGNAVVVPVHVFRGPIPEKNERPYTLSLLHATLRLLEEQDGNCIEEDSVGEWLNTIYNAYATDYSAQWLHQYQQATAGFMDEVLRSLVAFDADPDLAERFYAAFESVDVLPLRFEEEYFGLMRDGHFVDADGLVVNIAYWQYGMLKNRGKIRQGNRNAENPGERITVLMTPYDDQLGLCFEEEM